MDLTNWIITLATALLAVAFFCTRAPANWSMENRARRVTGTRLLAQAVLALWTGALIALHSLAKLGAPGAAQDSAHDSVHYAAQYAEHPVARHALHYAPSVALLAAAMLVMVGCYWLIRGGRLLKPRKLFTAY